MKNGLKIKRHLSSFQVIILGFAAVIFIGAFLLCLPISSQSGEFTSFRDALFTSTSATCVTGLVVVDTATHWSLFGQIVILFLIQIGGMGVVTVAASFAYFSGRKIGLMQRSTMQEAMSAQKVGGVVRLLRFVLLITFTFEAIGAIFLSIPFIRDFGIIKGVWYAIFHSISAFCNAGFDLLGAEIPFSSLTAYTVDPIINITICLLILFGGLGFLTWDDITTHKFRISKYRMQSKVILTMTLILTVFPAIFYFFVDFSNFELKERIFASIFQTVTPRTAGFNTVDLALMSEAGLLVMISLMLIGGASGSTAGGIKTTTIAVLFTNLLCVFRRKGHTECFKRRIESSTVKNAAGIFALYILLFLFGSVCISAIEGLPILTCMFEAGSAIATVGLTLGVTPSLSPASHIVLMVLMFLGRVGGLTLIYATVRGEAKYVSKYPSEKITIG